MNGSSPQDVVQLLSRAANTVGPDWARCNELLVTVLQLFASLREGIGVMAISMPLSLSH